MPGEDLQHAVIRRWVSPKEGKISIEGTVSHKTTASDDGDGVRARIVSSSLGELATWMVHGIEAETKISSIAVKAGDTIDFIVDGRSDTENDTFTWAPVIQPRQAKMERGLRLSRAHAKTAHRLAALRAGLIGDKRIRIRGLTSVNQT